MIPRLGLIGGPLLLVSAIATLFGLWDQVSAPSFFLTLPIGIWEFSFGVYMAFKGFRSTTAMDEAIVDVSSATFAGIGA